MNSSTYLSSPRPGDPLHLPGSANLNNSHSGVSNSTISQSRIYGTYGTSSYQPGDPMNTSTYSSLSARFAPRGHDRSIMGSPSNTSHTDAVLQKARDALEAQAHDLDRERRDKIDKEKRLHELEQALGTEKSAHYLTTTKLHESERRHEDARRHHDEQV